MRRKEQKEGVRNVIIVERGKLNDLVFPIAGINKNLRRYSLFTHIISFNPGQDYPLQELEKDMKRVVPPYHLYLLDVGPTGAIPASNWIYFASQQKDHIKLWLGNEFSKHDLKEISNYQITINPIKVGIFETLKSLGYHFWPYLIKAHQAMFHQDRNKLNSSHEAARYYLAEEALLQMGATLDGPEMYLLAIDTIQELSSGKESSKITHLVNWKVQAINYTMEAVRKFRSDYFFFQGAKKRNRPVGYADLGFIPDYADIEEIMYVGSSIFPHLTVVRYLLDGKIYLRYHSVICEVKLENDPTITAEQKCMLLNKAIINAPLATIN